MKYILVICAMSLALFAMINQGLAAGTGVVYFDTRTRQYLWQSAAPSLVGTSATDISTAAVNFPVAIPQNVPSVFWNGSILVPATALQSKLLNLANVRREIYKLQAVRSVAADVATTFELNLIDRDIEYFKRSAAQIQAGQ